MLKSVLGLAAALSLAFGAAQAAERTVTVSVDGQQIRVPVPEGYCQPTGAYVEQARAVAALDEGNETVLTLYDCAIMASGTERMERYAHLKFPRAASGQPVTVAFVRAAFPKSPSDFAKMVDQAVDATKVSKDFSVDVGTVEPVSEDDTGVYLAGVMAVQIGDEQVPLATAAGVTAVKGKMLSFNFYAKGGKVSDVAAQLAKARAAVRALAAANP